MIVWSLALPAWAWIGVAAVAGFQEVSDSANVQEDVRAIVSSLYEGKIDPVIELTHPVIIQAMGGPDAARVAMLDVVEKMRSVGMTLESLEFPEAPEFVSGEGRTFVVVPTQMVVSAGGQRVQSSNFQFGVLESDAEAWTYLDGSRITPELLEALFPEFPPDFEFPAVSRTKL